MIRSVFVLATLLVLPAFAWADHDAAVIGDSIDGNGNGTYAGNYVHQSGSNGDHPWFTFNAVTGDMIGIDLFTGFGNGSYLWLYRVLDNNAQVGDTPFGPTPDLSQVATSTNTDSLPGPFNDQSINYSVTDSGQYAVQVDSWLGGSGDYRLEIRGASGGGGVVPEPTSLAVFGVLTLTTVGIRRRRK